MYAAKAAFHSVWAKISLNGDNAGICNLEFLFAVSNLNKTYYLFGDWS
jgi:hypothetical protein